MRVTRKRMIGAPVGVQRVGRRVGTRSTALTGAQECDKREGVEWE